eukprot:Skav212080  [mRNA]  locus=scaffold867:168934:175123:- [translate_table: standard]
MAFMLLEESVQQQFVEVSYQELAAFANWRRSQDAKAFLAADLQWAALVTNPLGQEVKKPFKGEKDQSKKVPVKEEVKKPAKVKEEPRSEADRPKAPKEKVQQAPKEKAKPVQKHEAQKEKAVVVKQEKQTAPVQQQQAPKDKAIVVKQEPKQTAAVCRLELEVSQQQPLKDKAVEVKKEPVTEGVQSSVEKASAAREKVGLRYVQIAEASGAT